MRECHRNYAHGPMKLITKSVQVEYKGLTVTCKKTVYACEHCDFELFQDWMQKKYEEDLENSYLIAVNKS